MKKITELLMDYGVDFTYENNGSKGEIINAMEFDLKISQSQGVLYKYRHGELEENPFNEKSIKYLLVCLETILINETT